MNTLSKSEKEAYSQKVPVAENLNVINVILTDMIMIPYQPLVTKLSVLVWPSPKLVNVKS